MYVYFAFPVEHEWTSLNQERQTKFYKIQALYVPSFRNKPSEKYLVKVIRTEKALVVLPLILVTTLNADRQHQTSKKNKSLITGVNGHIYIKNNSNLLQLEKNAHLYPT